MRSLTINTVLLLAVSLVLVLPEVCGTNEEIRELQHENKDIEKAEAEFTILVAKWLSGIWIGPDYARSAQGASVLKYLGAGRTKSEVLAAITSISKNAPPSIASKIDTRSNWLIERRTECCVVTLAFLLKFDANDRLLNVDVVGSTVQ